VTPTPAAEFPPDVRRSHSLACVSDGSLSAPDNITHMVQKHFSEYQSQIIPITIVINMILVAFSTGKMHE